MTKQVDPDKVGKLQGAIQRASKLIRNDSAISEIARRKRGDIELSLNEDSDVSIDTMMGGYRDGGIQQPSRPAGRPVNDKVPSVIRESFMTNQINTDPLSALNDGRDISFVENVAGVRSRAVTESVQVQQPQVQQPQVQQYVTSGIDYPMIRTIVEDVMRKYASQLSKKILSESKGGGAELNTIMLGRNFKFLDKSGNIYECTMKKVGNVNDKK